MWRSSQRDCSASVEHEKKVFRLIRASYCWAMASTTRIALRLSPPIRKKFIVIADGPAAKNLLPEAAQGGNGRVGH